MSHFAKVVDGVVVQVIVAEQEFIDSISGEDNCRWIQTSYNTHGGVHTLGGTPLRMNYAAPGYTYDSELDAFIPPQPFSKWILNEATCLWEPPTPRPEGDVFWDDEAGVWAEKGIE